MSDEAVGLAWVAVGGALGALLRVYGPFSTLWVNVVGCLAMGAAMVVIERRVSWRHARELVTVGVLGGFTTFSGYFLAADNTDSAGAAAGYLVVSAAACLVAVAAGAVVTRRIVR